VGKRQKACPRDECQRERHRRNCSDWRDRDREDERERLLERVLATLEPKAPAGRPAEVLPHDLQDERRATVEVKIRKLVQLFPRNPRDEWPPKRAVKAGEDRQVPPGLMKDETDTRGLTP
jgi:hypothetical protein